MGDTPFSATYAEAAVQAQTRAAFYIDTDVWRGMVLGQSLIATR